MPTIFSKIIKKEVPAEIVYENDYILAFKDVNPQAPIHILIIPKVEIPTTNDLKENDSLYLSQMFMAAKKIAKKLKFYKSGYRLVFNCNEDGGQTVFHIHMHLLAGRRFSWPPG